MACPYLASDRIARVRWGKLWILDGRPAEAPPLVLTDTLKNAVRLVALEPTAEQRGLSLGQTLADARALCPDLDALPADTGADLALLETLAAWCDRYTPLVGLSRGQDRRPPQGAHQTGRQIIPGPPDGLFMDITGCAHLTGGEAALMDDVRRRLTAQGLHVTLGLADTPGAAWALARYGRGATGGHAGGLRNGVRPDGSPDQQADHEAVWQAGAIAPPQGQQGTLAPLPLGALRLDADTITGLGRVGFKTVGCIADLPRAPLATRFGAALLTRLDQALGQVPEGIAPRLPVSDLAAEQRFFDPITHQDDIARVIALLADALGPMLTERGVGARALELRLYRVDGVVESLCVQAANPLRDGARITRLFAERIAGLAREIDAGFGFDLVRLAVAQSEPWDGAQTDLVRGGAAQDGYGALIDRLGARLGTDRVRGFAGADTHIPERAFGTLPVARLRDRPPGRFEGRFAGQIPLPADLRRARRGGGARRVPFGTSAADAPLRGAPGRSGGRLSPVTRPLYLLRQPEPVFTLAEVPDGPPLRFRWRKVTYDVARTEGPERIACEWWRDGRRGQTRDYFRIEDRGGYRFWMFRNGLYASETPAPRWYMHGMFA